MFLKIRGFEFEGEGFCDYRKLPDLTDAAIINAIRYRQTMSGNSSKIPIRDILIRTSIINIVLFDDRLQDLFRIETTMGIFLALKEDFDNDLDQVYKKIQRKSHEDNL